MKFMKHIKGVLLLLVIVLCSIVCTRNIPANAAELRLVAEYDRFTPSNCLEIKLNIDSDSALTMLKYTNKRISNSRHFTKYEQNGFVIEANDGYGPVELQSEVFNIVTEYSPIVPEHTHNFVEGKCECGEEDPNYVAPEEPKKKCGKKSADIVTAAIALTAGISIIFRKKD